MENGQSFLKLGTKNRQTQILRWKEGDDANWMFTVGAREMNYQVLGSKCSIEELKEETSQQMLKNMIYGSVDVKSMDTDEHETFNIGDQSKVLQEESFSTEKLCESLLVKDKYSV